jgi:hypothetical protein
VNTRNVVFSTITMEHQSATSRLKKKRSQEDAPRCEQTLENIHQAIMEDG